MASSGQKPGFWPPARNLRNRVFFPFLRLHGVFWAKTRFLATRASSDGDRQIFTLYTASRFQSSV